jgi:hypothetical protein
MGRRPSPSHIGRHEEGAQALNAAGFGTLLFDLLTVEEEPNRANVFDIGLLASRLVGVTTWLAAKTTPRRFRSAILVPAPGWASESVQPKGFDRRILEVIGTNAAATIRAVLADVMLWQVSVARWTLR